MVRAALVSFAAAALIVAGWSAESEGNAVATAAIVVLYLSPLVVGATGWQAALMLPVWAFAGAVVANYGPAPLAWDANSAIGVPIFAGALACVAAAARTSVLGLARWRRGA